MTTSLSAIPPPKPSLSMRARRRAFHLCSLLFAAVYGRWPVFGRLRSAAAVIEQEGQFLVVDRSDGRGWSFPGGMSSWHEPEEKTVCREVEEETGLHVTSLRFLFRYADDHNFPSWVSVFAATAEGRLRGSWEGEPAWKALNALQPMFACQQPIVAYVLAGRQHEQG